MPATRRYLPDLLSNPPAPRVHHSVVMPTILPAHTLGIVFKLAKWKYLSRPVTVGHNPCILKWTMDVGDHICTYRITLSMPLANAHCSKQPSRPRSPLEQDSFSPPRTCSICPKVGPRTVSPKWYTLLPATTRS